MDATLVLRSRLGDFQSRIIIAIVSTNDVKHIIGCLRSLATSKYRNFRVLICENGGAKSYEALVKTLAGLEFIRERQDLDETISTLWPNGYENFCFVGSEIYITVLNAADNLGYAGGVNACIRAVPGHAWDGVWVLNPDTFPDPNALKALVEHQQKGSYGIVGSRLLVVSGDQVQTWGGMKWIPCLGRARAIGRNRPAETKPDIGAVESSIDFISGASMYLPRSYIDAVGLMDDEFFVYNEDVDWCLRRNTFKLGYAHDSIVRHVGGGTSGEFVKSGTRFTVYLDARNRMLLFKKQYRVIWPSLSIIALGLTLEYIVRAHSLRAFVIALDGWRAGVLGETGAPYFLKRYLKR